MNDVQKEDMKSHALVKILHKGFCFCIQNKMLVTHRMMVCNCPILSVTEGTYYFLIAYFFLLASLRITSSVFSVISVNRQPSVSNREMSVSRKHATIMGDLS